MRWTRRALVASAQHGWNLWSGHLDSELKFLAQGLARS